MYQAQTEIIVEMKIRSKKCISNTGEGNRIGGMFLLKKQTKATNIKCIEFLASVCTSQAMKLKIMETRIPDTWETLFLGTFHVGHLITQKRVPQAFGNTVLNIFLIRCKSPNIRALHMSQYFDMPIALCSVTVKIVLHACCHRGWKPWMTKDNCTSLISRIWYWAATEEL